MYGIAIILNWEYKNQDATEAFVVVQTVASYIGLFSVVWGLVCLQWLGYLENINGVESLVSIIAAICCGMTGSWGSTIMSDWIGRGKFENISLLLLLLAHITIIFLI
jgi:hypothetical protein